MIRCTIIDDEPLAIKLLETYISKMDNLVLVSSFSNPLDALQSLKTEPVDLLFLDIQMPELKGTELAKLIPQHTKIIFTTAYPNYAVEGFELKALDYLLKPISFPRFITAVERFSEANEKVQMEVFEKTTEVDFIFVKTENRKQKIDLKEILYLKGMGDYCQIVLADQKVMTLEKMQSFVARLPETQFRRVHKSYVIAINKIEYIEKARIKISDALIPIGQTYAANLKDLLD